MQPAFSFDRALKNCRSRQADGIILVKTTQAVLVAEYAHPTTPGDATKLVEGERSLPPHSEPQLLIDSRAFADLADYLISVGY